MSTIMETTPQAVQQKRDAFAEKVLRAAAGAFETFSIYLGDRLGYYAALAESGALTSGELAAATRTSERYVREWLEQQVVVGILEVDDPGAPAELRRFSLPAGHDEVLADPESLNYLAPLSQMIAGAVGPLEAVREAYRHGGGVPYEAYGAEFREGQGRVNRAAFLHQLGQEWLPAIPDVDARLRGEPGARVADIGCGVGWSSIGIARCYPNVRVDGFDTDAPSVELAREHARQAELAERVRFLTQDAAAVERAGDYDLVIALECVHDMTDPVSALRTMRRMARPDGAVIVVDERVASGFLEEGGDVEWLMYGWSVLHCLPVSLAEAPAAGTGTVMRPDTLARYATQAGFGRVEVLPIENFLFRFYRLHP